jgi:hypothetical protein
MSLRGTIAALGIATMAYVGMASAQENVTITLRSGERLTAQLVDMGGSGFALKVNGQDRQVATGDVAVIDFAGGTMNESDWGRLSGGQHVVWLRNGQVLTAELVDVGGTSPLRITVRDANGNRDLTSTEVSRIVLARPTNVAATTGTGTTGSTAASDGSVIVSARQQWTPTGITVRRGETLRITTTGEIQLSADSNDVASPAGAKSGRYPTANAPMPRVLAGGLLGRIGNGQPFPIGDQTSLPMPAAGQLFLGINDDEVNDNSGEFRVQITRAQRR